MRDQGCWEEQGGGGQCQGGCNEWGEDEGGRRRLCAKVEEEERERYISGAEDVIIAAIIRRWRGRCNSHHTNRGKSHSDKSSPKKDVAAAIVIRRQKGRQSLLAEEQSLEKETISPSSRLGHEYVGSGRDETILIWFNQTKDSNLYDSSSTQPDFNQVGAWPAQRLG